jgi:hypothetical protein
MKDCISVAPDTGPLTPEKRVNYAQGMVLGAADLRQEQAHVEWKQRISNLLLHGYGTVCGLAVSAETVSDRSDVEIRVAPGFAIGPDGHWIHVPREQCALLGSWARRRIDGKDPVRGRHRAYVTLCYRECETDLVPIAGHPCATAEDNRAPSRVLESFRIEFTWAPPPQVREDAVRAFGELLERVDIEDAPRGPGDDAEFLHAVRRICEGVEPSPPAAETFEWSIRARPQPAIGMREGFREAGSPPATLTLNADTACDTIRQALTIWATQACPSLDGERCLLLSCVNFELSADLKLVPESVVVDDCVRPVLVPTRLQQELFCLIGRRGGKPVNAGIRVSGGTVIFNELSPAERLRISPFIEHHLGTTDVAIVLAIDMGDMIPGYPNVVMMNPVAEMGMLRPYAFYDASHTPGRFRILLDISRTKVTTARVRWWAIPNGMPQPTVVVGRPTASPPAAEPTAPEAGTHNIVRNVHVLMRVAAEPGVSRTVLAREIGVSAAELKIDLDRLAAGGLIRVAGSRIHPG